jgi:DNA-binding HxlR family transcriptional regulator
MPRDEYCPIYKSLDLFGDRWGLLLVREILRGVTRFNELERNLPGISRSTLAQRLRHLEKEAIVERQASEDGRGTEYGLSERGTELVSVLQAVNDWGLRWLVPDARPSEVDPDGLMQWVSRHVVLRELPDKQIVIRFELLGRSRRRFWLVLRTNEASLCPEHPGFPEDLYITSTPAELYQLVVGRQSLKQAMEEGAVKVDGPPRLVRSLPRWFLLRASGPPVVAMSPSQ